MGGRVPLLRPEPPSPRTTGRRLQEATVVEAGARERPFALVGGPEQSHVVWVLCRVFQGVVDLVIQFANPAIGDRRGRDAFGLVLLFM